MKKLNWTRKVFFCFVVFIANLPVAQILFPFWALTRVVCRRLVRLVFALSWYWLWFSGSFLRKDLNKAIDENNSCENCWRYRIINLCSSVQTDFKNSKVSVLLIDHVSTEFLRVDVLPMQGNCVSGRQNRPAQRFYLLPHGMLQMQNLRIQINSENVLQ